MTPDDLRRERDRAVTSEEIEERRDEIRSLYDHAIDLRKRFERAAAENSWDETAAEERIASLVFGDGSEGNDQDAIGQGS